MADIDKVLKQIPFTGPPVPRVTEHALIAAVIDLDAHRPGVLGNGPRQINFTVDLVDGLPKIIGIYIL